MGLPIELDPSYHAVTQPWQTLTVGAWLFVIGIWGKRADSDSSENPAHATSKACDY